jgi:hypothetical protein
MGSVGVCMKIEDFEGREIYLLCGIILHAGK